MYHAHLDTWSRDCDGPHEYHRVSVMQEDEDEYDFEERILHLVSHWPATWSDGTPTFDGPQTLELGITDEGRKYIKATQALEEGGCNEQVAFCRDDCDMDEHWVRDVFAERMGY